MKVKYFIGIYFSYIIVFYKAIVIHSVVIEKLIKRHVITVRYRSNDKWRLVNY